MQVDFHDVPEATKVGGKPVLIDGSKATQAELWLFPLSCLTCGLLREGLEGRHGLGGLPVHQVRTGIAKLYRDLLTFIYRSIRPDYCSSLLDGDFRRLESKQ